LIAFVEILKQKKAGFRKEITFFKGRENAAA